MGGLFSYLLLTLFGIVLGFAIPHEIAEESRIAVRWQHRPMVATLPVSVTDQSQDTVTSPEEIILGITPDYYVRLGGSDGVLIGGEPRADLFAATRQYTINQDIGDSRLRVRSWKGETIRTVERVGVPSFAGSMLYQIDPSGAFFIVDLSRGSGESLRIDGTDNTVVHHLCGACERPLLVRGTWLGRITVDFLDTPSVRSYEFDVAPFDSQVPTVFGVHAIDPDRIVVVSGSNPQWVVILSANEENELVERSRYSVSTESAIRHPLRVTTIDDDTVAIPFRSSILLLDTRGDSGRWIKTPGIHDVVGGYTTGDHTVLATAETSGTGLAITDGQGLLRWSWDQAEMIGIAGKNDPFFLIEIDGLVLAVEVLR